MPKTTNPFAKKKKPHSASPLSSVQRTKPGSTGITKHDGSQRLEDSGYIPSLAPSGVDQDVISLWHFIWSNAFDEIPDRAAGMNSERISEILRFRQALPPIISIAHLHALSSSTTQTERDLAKLIAVGKFRKVIIPGRGRGGSAIGEGVVLVEEWKSRVQADSRLGEELKQLYIRELVRNTDSSSFSCAEIDHDAVRDLVAAGYLTSPAALSSFDPGALFVSAGASSLLAVSKAGSAATTGTLAAVGGAGAIQNHGGGGSMLATKQTRMPRSTSDIFHMTFSLPGTGSYLKLLTEARLHLLHSLKQLSPRHKEATWDSLKEKWDGNTINDAASRAKRARGEFAGVLPGKTKRWRDFYGLDFEWVLAECVGSGVMELFDTGSVGLAIRAR